MSAEKKALNQIVTESTHLLQQTELQLKQLAHLALVKHQQFENDGDNDQLAVERLRQISEQLAKLSQRSHDMHRYLANGLETPPVDDDHWSQIKILQSQEEERTQLARELEDGVGQLLANAVFELAACRLLLSTGSDSVADGLDALQAELEQGLADIRHIITDLEPASILSNFGLSGGIRRYLEQFETRTGITTVLQMNTNVGRLPNTVEVAIFRIIQEALQNAQRHANASQIEVVVAEIDGDFQFRVADNGSGMASDRVDLSKKNFGLARMVDYAELLDGRLQIFSEPERGTTVILTVPYHAL